MAGIAKWFKVTVLHLKAKFLLYPNWKKEVIFGLKINFSELFSKSFDYSKVSYMAGVKRGQN